LKMDLRYLGQSEVRSSSSGGAEVRFSPNLSRSRVFFDAELAYPLRFREAVSALHDVVVGDLRFKKKDRTAHREWKKEQAQRDAEVRRTLMDAAKRAELARIAKEPIPPNLEADFRKMHRLYWNARVRWAHELSRNDPELFRHLVPCDPVVTVADDVVFFECFSKDESAYGCLSVDRGALKASEAGRGTTNVDYSLALYEHFQTLRSYRQTRLLVDPAGFEVKVEGREDYREEKIDLPPSWLRGFAQLQAAMTLPSRKVELPVEAVYGILAHLKRHREKTGPRSIRFQLAPGKAPTLVLDPWGIPIRCHGPRMEDAAPAPAGGFGGPAGVAQGAQRPQERGDPGGPPIVNAVAGGAHGPYRSPPVVAAAPALPTVDDRPEEIKIWGRRRLFALARLLPICDRVEVRLLGSGLPSVWIAHLGEMRFTLALSGWTANDWSSGANLSLLAGAAHTDPRTMAAVQEKLSGAQHASAEELAEAAGVKRDVTLASLHELCKHGQAIYDFAAGCYRYREVMPFALSEAVLGPEHPELVEGRAIVKGKRVRVQREQALEGGRRLYVFEAGGVQAEAMIDGDGVLKTGKCSCSFFYKSRLRAGPCRHLVALRLHLAGSPSPAAPPAPPTPAAATPAPVSGARGPVRREEVVSLAQEVLKEIRARADEEDKGISDVVEDAWDAAFERMQASQGWKDALKLVDPRRTEAVSGRSVSSPVQQTVLLHEEVLREIALVADRFGASPSAVVNLAWLIARNDGGP